MNPQMLYWSNAPAEDMPLELTISADAAALLKVPSNRGLLPPPSVGLYRAALKDKQFEPLQAALSAPAFAALPDPQNVRSGEVVRRLAITPRPGAQTTKYAASSIPTPPAFSAAEKPALDLVALLRGSPLYALLLDYKPPVPNLPRGNALELSLTLSNPGTEAVAVFHPLHWLAHNVAFTLNARRSDIPPAQREPYHQHFISLDPHDLPELKGLAKAPATVVIPAGGLLRVNFRKTLDLPPGAYTLELAALLPLLDAQARPLLSCELIARPFNLQIAGAAKPGDVPTEAEINLDEQEPPEVDPPDEVERAHA